MITQALAPASTAVWRSNRRIYLDKDGKVVTDEKTQEPHTLLCGVNGEIPLERAKALGLVDQDATTGPLVVNTEVDLEALAAEKGLVLVAKSQHEKDQADFDTAKADLEKANADLVTVTADRDQLRKDLETAKKGGGAK